MVSARGDHTQNNSTRVLHNTCRPILHFICRGWSDDPAPTKHAIPIFSFWSPWMNPNPSLTWGSVWVFKKFSFPLLTPPWPTHLIMTWPTYLPTSFYTPSHHLPTYQSPTYLFPCTLPHSCTHLIFHVFFFLVNKLATPCSLMLLYCFFMLFLIFFPWQAMSSKLFFLRNIFWLAFCFLTSF